MMDQEARNLFALKLLDYDRAVDRLMVEAIEKGFPVSERVLEKLDELHSAAYALTTDEELKDVF